MRDVCHHGGAETSMEAFSKVAPHVREMQETILKLIAGAVAPPTASDLMQALPDMLPYTLRPRITELRQMDLISIAGKAVNPNGNNERTYIATPTGLSCVRSLTKGA